VLTFWHGLDVGIQAAIIGVGGTLLTAALALIGLAVQLGSQAKQSREAIAENERRKLKAEMYASAVEISRAMADASISLSTALRIWAGDVRAAAAAAKMGHPPIIPSARFPALSALYGEFSGAVYRFIFLVEERRFIDPRLTVFRTAMSALMHDTRQIMFAEFFQTAMPALPVDGPDGHLLPYPPPSPETANRVSELTGRFIESLDDALMYSEDFLVEMQNRLLGDLFGHVVPHRAPPDPDKRVISLDHFEELEAWFNNSTAWGQECARIEAEARQRFAPGEGDAPA